MKRVVVLGSNGMLGRDVVRVLEEKGNNLEVFKATRHDIDFLDKASVENFFKKYDFNYIVNCIAYTDVEKAEEEYDLAYKVNTVGPSYLAQICQSLGGNKKLIHISTDYVFGGEYKEGGYRETDSPNPINAYGRTKYLGEMNIINVMEDNYYIIRTSWLFGNNRKNFVRTIIKLAMQGEELKIVNDQIGSPTYTMDLANVILKFIENEDLPFGIYHYSGEGETSWWEFAKEIVELSREKFNNIKTKIILGVPTESFNFKAKRPRYSYLSKEKIKSILGDNIVKKWQDSLREYLNDIQFYI